jgi:hypothetical protein
VFIKFKKIIGFMRRLSLDLRDTNSGNKDEQKRGEVAGYFTRHKDCQRTLPARHPCANNSILF